MKRFCAQFLIRNFFFVCNLYTDLPKKKKIGKVKWAISLKFHMYGKKKILPIVSFTFPTTGNIESWGSYIIGKILFIDLGDACIDKRLAELLKIVITWLDGLMSE